MNKKLIVFPGVRGLKFYIITRNKCFFLLDRSLKNSVKSSRYIHLRVFGKRILLHRYVYELNNGPIPDGMLIMHICDNPACFNPEHLFIGTHEHNMRDMVSKKRQCWGIKKASAKLTPAKVKNIREIKDKSAKELSIKYKVDQARLEEYGMGKDGPIYKLCG